MNSKEFEEAKDALDAFPQEQNNDTKLALYAYYKQATVGDATGPRPGFTQMVARAKYDAWAKLKGTSTADAEAGYIAEANRVLGR